MLLETLKHELELDDPRVPLPDALAGRGLPIDAIWSGFAVEDSFFEPIRGGGERPARFPRSAQRDILRALVAAQEAGEEPDAPPPEAIPAGWQFVKNAWDVVRRFAFLEYYLVYAFNDYKQYGKAFFENEHEGDVEGCCVVFERRVLEQYAADTEEALPDPLLNAAREVVPHTVITAGHEESQDLDDCKRLPVVRDSARADLLVYVAAGSHSTWLSNRSHDILDFEDVATKPAREAPTPLVVLPPVLLALLAIGAVFGIIEHFVDAEDFTSDNGVKIGPGPADPSPGSLKFDKRLEVTPLADIQGDLGNNIYQDTPALRAALAVRGFPGKWGGDDSLFDKSPPWQNKTARYFRRFLRADIRPTTPVVDVDLA
jgi:hypothetical protein